MVCISRFFLLQASDDHAKMKQHSDKWGVVCCFYVPFLCMYKAPKHSFCWNTPSFHAVHMLDALVSLPLKSSFSIVFGLAEVWRKLDFLYTSPPLFPFLCLCFLFTSRIYTSQGSSLIMHRSVHRVLFNNKWIHSHLYSSEKKKTYYIQRIIERE